MRRHPAVVAYTGAFGIAVLYGGMKVLLLHMDLHSGWAPTPYKHEVDYCYMSTQVCM